MATDLAQPFIKQLDAVIEGYEELAQRAPSPGLSGLPLWEYQKVITQAQASIERISPPGAAYRKRSEDILKSKRSSRTILQLLVGVVEGLRADLAAGYLTSFQELVHAETFVDFLDMAEHLADGGYKDPAAVIAGSTLEAHLRALAIKTGLSVSKNAGRSLKADRLNADLAKEEVYSKLDQKSVTAWLDIRNKAAHGHYPEYSAPQVRLMLDGIRDFVVRNPA